MCMLLLQVRLLPDRLPLVGSIKVTTWITSLLSKLVFVKVGTPSPRQPSTLQGVMNAHAGPPAAALAAAGVKGMVPHAVSP